MFSIRFVCALALVSGFTAYAADPCKQGYVWREAFSGDHVCVTPAARAQTARDNSGPYHAEPCRSGFVWREAVPDDHICVPVARRSAASQLRARSKPSSWRRYSSTVAHQGASSGGRVMAGSCFIAAA